MKTVEKEFGKTLNKNGWQNKLYKYVYSREYGGIGYCPFFWLTVMACFLAPFVFLGQSVEKGINLLKDFWPERIEKETEYVSNPWDIKWVYNLDSEEQESFIKYTDFGGWVEKNPNWKEIYKAQKDKEKEKERKIAELNAIRWEKEAARRAKLDAKMVIITKYAGYFVKPLLAASAIFAGWLIWVVAAFLVSVITWHDIVISAQALGVLAVIGGVLFGAWKVIGKAIDFVEKTRKVIEPKREIEDEIKEPGIFCKAGDAIYEAFNFLIETVKMTYEKKCPLIEWGDETKKIEKIKKS